MKSEIHYPSLDPEPPQYQTLYSKKEEDDISISNSSHPFACIFTFAFKVAAFVVYFFLGWFFDDVHTFIIVILLSSFDFWTVKNVTGRLLVGLRWSSDFDDNGKEVWRFDSYNKQFHPSPADSYIFWVSQLASTITWAVFAVLNILTFSIFWAVLCFVNLSLSGINLIGYYKCRGCTYEVNKEHNKKIDSLKKSMLQKGLQTFFTGK